MDTISNKIILTVALLFITMCCIPDPLLAQFEQKLSVSLSGGYFNTFGGRDYAPEGVTNPDPMEPTLMPNFEFGGSITAGIQYNFSRHLSVEFQFSAMFSPGWYYDYSYGDEDPLNYLYYEIETERGSGIVMETGENYMDLFNLQIGIAPRYYFLPGKRVNPFIFAGITLNNTDVYFENFEADAYEQLGRLDEYYEYEENYALVNWFDYHYGLGVNAGAGFEFVISDYLGLFMKASYDFVPLKEEAFVYETKYVNFNAINIQLGVKVSFLKSKDL